MAKNRFSILSPFAFDQQALFSFLLFLKPQFENLPWRKNLWNWHGKSNCQTFWHVHKYKCHIVTSLLTNHPVGLKLAVYLLSKQTPTPLVETNRDILQSQNIFCLTLHILVYQNQQTSQLSIQCPNAQIASETFTNKIELFCSAPLKCFIAQFWQQHKQHTWLKI